RPRRSTSTARDPRPTPPPSSAPTAPSTPSTTLPSTPSDASRTAPGHLSGSEPDPGERRPPPSARHQALTWSSPSGPARTLRHGTARLSAQIRSPQAKNPQVSEPPPRSAVKRVTSQVTPSAAWQSRQEPGRQAAGPYVYSRPALGVNARF